MISWKLCHIYIYIHIYIYVYIYIYICIYPQSWPGFPILFMFVCWLAIFPMPPFLTHENHNGESNQRGSRAPSAGAVLPTRWPTAMVLNPHWLGISSRVDRCWWDGEQKTISWQDIKFYKLDVGWTIFSSWCWLNYIFLLMLVELYFLVDVGWWCFKRLIPSFSSKLSPKSPPKNGGFLPLSSPNMTMRSKRPIRVASPQCRSPRRFVLEIWEMKYKHGKWQ